MTQKQFEHLNNQRRAEMSPPHHPVTFPLTKRKVVTPRQERHYLSPSGIPRIEIISPVVTKVVPDTGMKQKLFQAVWEYYMGTKLKRQESEGKHRGGFKDKFGKWVAERMDKSTNRGMSDLKGGYNGKEYHIEQKEIGELHLQSQAEYAEWVRSYGGTYVTARTFEDIYDICQRILNGEPLDKYFEINTGKKRAVKGGLFD